MNITTDSVTQHELTGFMVGYEYNITIRGVNCGSQAGIESEPLMITPQGILESFGRLFAKLVTDISVANSDTIGKVYIN